MHFWRASRTSALNAIPRGQTSRALSATQEFLFRYGYEPTEVIAKGKNLLAIWIHRQAKVAAFEDAFVFAALFIAIGILPALLIREEQFSTRERKGPVN